MNFDRDFDLFSSTSVSLHSILSLTLILKVDRKCCNRWKLDPTARPRASQKRPVSQMSLFILALSGRSLQTTPSSIAPSGTTELPASNSSSQTLDCKSLGHSVTGIHCCYVDLAYCSSVACLSLCSAVQTTRTSKNSLKLNKFKLSQETLPCPV